MEYEQSAADKLRRIANGKIAVKDKAALLYMLKEPEGRWFLMRLFERCHLISDAPFPEDNVHRLLIMEGERRVGLHIKNLVTDDLASLASLAAKQQAESEYYTFMNELESLIRAAEKEENT
ncbi:hypothetical protein [uncultured Selenomonas sp.]|uniref:Bbp19 family protein n=1 Tax=uncultured Selenomonas sp. TaxID=159275 RepID=UPI0028D52966|nr:hypothetical protein [uncultured Selenomonas sp.]